RSAGCDKNNSGLTAFALKLRQHGIGAWACRKADANIEPLRDRGRKSSPSDWRDREAVDGDEFALERAEAHVKGAHRRTVDDPQEQPSARLDLDDLRIGERAVIGEKGVIFDVVE